MKSLIETIARSIVSDEDTLDVVESTGRYQTTLTVRAANADVGKLLGKRGKTIGAIRNLMDLASGGTHHYTVWVEGVAPAFASAAK